MSFAQPTQNLQTRQTQAVLQATDPPSSLLNQLPDRDQGRAGSIRLARSSNPPLGSNNRRFTVIYRANAGLNPRSIDSNDLEVKGPNGFRALLDLVKVRFNRQKDAARATYEMTAPDGTWDGADNGTYQVRLRKGGVRDRLGRKSPSRRLDRFVINYPNFEPATTNGTIVNGTIVIDSGSSSPDNTSPDLNSGSNPGGGSNPGSGSNPGGGSSPGGGGSNPGGDPLPDGSTISFASNAHGVSVDLSQDIARELQFTRLLPLGDSITAGQHSRGAVPGGYRIQMWNRFVSDGLQIDFVGSQNNSSLGLGDGDHEGRPGWRIGRITDDIIRDVDNGDDYLTRYPADAILLMIGTNDINSGASENAMIGGSNPGDTNYANSLSELIDEITARSPNSHLLVSSIPPVDAPRGSAAEAQNVIDYNALIPGLVADKAAQGKRVYYVNAGGGLTVGDINGEDSDSVITHELDGLHPTEAGYNKMGNLWYEGLKSTGLIQETVLDAAITNIIGSAFNDTLKGDSGVNTMTGGGGADIFVYANPNEGNDIITDFGSDDVLRISASGFGGGLAAGVGLSNSASATGTFISGSNPTPVSNNAHFFYDTDTGELSFDADGSGSNATAITIATLSNQFGISANQIQIV